MKRYIYKVILCFLILIDKPGLASEERSEDNSSFVAVTVGVKKFDRSPTLLRREGTDDAWTLRFYVQGKERVATPKKSNNNNIYTLLNYNAPPSTYHCFMILMVQKQDSRTRKDNDQKSYSRSYIQELKKENNYSLIYDLRLSPEYLIKGKDDPKKRFTKGRLGTFYTTLSYDTLMTESIEAKWRDFHKFEITLPEKLNKTHDFDFLCGSWRVPSSQEVMQMDKKQSNIFRNHFNSIGMIDQSYSLDRLVVMTSLPKSVFQEGNNTTHTSSDKDPTSLQSFLMLPGIEAMLLKVPVHIVPAGGFTYSPQERKDFTNASSSVLSGPKADHFFFLERDPDQEGQAQKIEALKNWIKAITPDQPINFIMSSDPLLENREGSLWEDFPEERRTIINHLIEKNLPSFVWVCQTFGNCSYHHFSIKDLKLEQEIPFLEVALGQFLDWEKGLKTQEEGDDEEQKRTFYKGEGYKATLINKNEFFGSGYYGQLSFIPYLRDLTIQIRKGFEVRTTWSYKIPNPSNTKKVSSETNYTKKLPTPPSNLKQSSSLSEEKYKIKEPLLEEKGWQQGAHKEEKKENKDLIPFDVRKLPPPPEKPLPMDSGGTNNTSQGGVAVTSVKGGVKGILIHPFREDVRTASAIASIAGNNQNINNANVRQLDPPTFGKVAGRKKGQSKSNRAGRNVRVTTLAPGEAVMDIKQEERKGKDARYETITNYDMLLPSHSVRNLSKDQEKGEPIPEEKEKGGNVFQSAKNTLFKGKGSGIFSGANQGKTGPGVTANATTLIHAVRGKSAESLSDTKVVPQQRRFISLKKSKQEPKKQEKPESKQESKQENNSDS